MLGQLSGATRLFPIIGDPIKYVESPMRLTRTFAERGYNGICVPMQVPADDLDAVMAGLTASQNVDGILVTMPHKFTAFAHCATSSERAKMLGVVSVIRRNPDGTWHGDMLDGLAFVKAQKDHGARAGGSAGHSSSAPAARAARSPSPCSRPGSANSSSTMPTSRGSRRSSSCSSGIGRGRVSAGPPDPDRLRSGVQRDSHGHGGDDPLPVDAALLTSSMFVGDVIAGHGVTPFLEAAEAAGCKTANGGHMVEAAQDVMADFMLRKTDSPTG